MDLTKPGLENEQISSSLAGLVGQNRISKVETNHSEYKINTSIVVQPENEKQVVEVLHFADQHRLSVAPRGGGTKDAYRQSTEPVDLILSMKGISGVLEHSAGDLMVTSLAGTTLRELQATLRTAGQFLPLDVPWDDKSTIGGIVNSGASGLLRAGYGSVRDFLISSRIVYPDGRVIRTGAKVMKNVAGYDMNKLFIGSMGTLGIHTEFTFKIRPIPVGHHLLVLGNADLESMRNFQHMVLDSQLEPCVFEWISKETVKQFGTETTGGIAILLGFADVWTSVDDQVRNVKHLCEDLKIAVLAGFRGAEEFESAISKVKNILPDANVLENYQSIVSLKLMGKLTDVQAMYEAAERRSEEYGFSMNFSGGALTGIARTTVDATQSGETYINQRLIDWIHKMQSDMRKIGVRTVVDFAPASIRHQISIWDEPTADQKIMRAIKRTIDPNETLNPSRTMWRE